MTRRWKLERQTHCFVLSADGRRPNIKIVYGDTPYNKPLYGDLEEARATAVIIEHALNGITLCHPKDATVLQIVRAWRECPEEKRPSEEALALAVIAAVRASAVSPADRADPNIR